jgi:hypothetical protein
MAIDQCIQLSPMENPCRLLLSLTN